VPRPLAGALLAVTLIAASPAGEAGELTVLSPRGVQAPLAALAERFEADPGHRVRFVFETAGAVARRAAEGEAADVVISEILLHSWHERTGITLVRIGRGAARGGTTAPSAARH